MLHLQHFLNLLPVLFYLYIEIFVFLHKLRTLLLKEFEIETSEFDYYFVKGNDGLVPVGYYRKKHQVESVLLLSEKIEKQNAKTVDIKAKLIETFEKESQSVNTEYEKFKKAKKASLFR